MSREAFVEHNAVPPHSLCGTLRQILVKGPTNVSLRSRTAMPQQQKHAFVRKIGCVMKNECCKHFHCHDCQSRSTGVLIVLPQWAIGITPLMLAWFIIWIFFLPQTLPSYWVEGITNFAAIIAQSAMMAAWLSRTTKPNRTYIHLKSAYLHKDYRGGCFPVTL